MVARYEEFTKYVDVRCSKLIWEQGRWHLHDVVARDFDTHLFPEKSKLHSRILLPFQRLL